MLEVRPSCASDQVVLLHKTIRGPAHLLQARSQRHFMPPSSGSCPSALSSPPPHHLNPCTLSSTCTALAACFKLTAPVHLQFPLPGLPFPWDSVRLFPHPSPQMVPYGDTFPDHPLCTPPDSTPQPVAFSVLSLLHSSTSI